MLDQALRDLLISFFIDHEVSREMLDGQNGSLYAFSNRIKACRALGLFESDVISLNLIRKIRNDAAHDISFQLETTLI